MNNLHRAALLALVTSLFGCSTAKRDSLAGKWIEISDATIVELLEDGTLISTEIHYDTTNRTYGTWSIVDNGKVKTSVTGDTFVSDYSINDGVLSVNTTNGTYGRYIRIISKSGKGECLAPPPHTTGHAGPHPAVHKTSTD